MRQEAGRALHAVFSFSALQRAENSSISCKIGMPAGIDVVSVLFSEPKIPQYHANHFGFTRAFHVSVLFSEPKIPQSLTLVGFGLPEAVSVLFSEPKIPQCKFVYGCAEECNIVSVLFSEPKIPQSIKQDRPYQPRAPPFQCSSASRKFLNNSDSPTPSRHPRVSVLFSEPKIPQS